MPLVGKGHRMNASLILNTHNEGPDVAWTIESFRAAAAAAAGADVELEVVVVADGTTDGSCDALGEDIKVVQPNVRVGIGAAKIIALKHATGDVLLHADAHSRWLEGGESLHDFLAAALAEPCIVTPAVAPLHCAREKHCGRHGSKRCEIICPEYEDSLQSAPNAYFGGSIEVKEGILAASWTTRRPGQAVSRTLVTAPAIFAYSRETLARIAGWNRYPGWWGSQEIGLALRAWYTDTAIYVHRDAVALHRYRSWNGGKPVAPYQIPPGHRGTNSRYATRIVSEDETWEKFWGPLFSRLDPNPAADEALEDSEIERQRSEFLPHRTRTDREFFDEVLNRPYPLDWKRKAGATRALYYTGTGFGNALLAVPAQKALASLTDSGQIDLVDVGLHQGANAREVFEKQPWVRKVLLKTDAIPLDEYQYIASSYWTTTPDWLPIGVSSASARRAWRTQHEVECNMEAVRRLGYQGITPSATLMTWDVVTPAPQGEYIVIGPGMAGKASKAYPHWERVARLLTDAGVQIVWSGAQRDDRPFMDRFGINGCGKTTLIQAAGLLWKARLYVGIDNGLSHLAAAVGCPSVLIYGPSSERKNCPWSQAVRILRSNVCDRAPCWDHPNAGKCEYESDDRRPCMEALGSDYVAGVVLDALNRPGWQSAGTGPRFLSVKQVAVNCDLDPCQEWAEFGAFFDLIRNRAIKTVVEIGSASGGWLHVVGGMLPGSLKLISIDPHPRRVQGPNLANAVDCREKLAEAGRLLERTGHRFVHIAKPSGDAIDDVISLLQGRGIDMLHIDGDHSMEAAVGDYNAYVPLVNHGGVVVIHDLNIAGGPQAAFELMKTDPRFAFRTALWGNKRRGLRYGIGVGIVK